MTTFKVTERQNDHYGKEYPEYTKFPRQGGIVTWVSLLVGPNKVQKFALCNLEEVREPFMTDMLYTCELPPRMVALQDAADMLAWDIADARVEWNWPHVFMTPAEAANVNASAHVRICIRKPATVTALQIVRAVAQGQLPERKAA